GAPDTGQNPPSSPPSSRPTLSDFDDPTPTSTPTGTPDAGNTSRSADTGTGSSSPSNAGLSAPTPQPAPTPPAGGTPSSTGSSGDYLRVWDRVSEEIVAAFVSDTPFTGADLPPEGILLVATECGAKALRIRTPTTAIAS
ncbi:hypothetical protein ACWDZ4_25315, partial [Streptomyces sp. NPDC003016]